MNVFENNSTYVLCYFKRSAHSNGLAIIDILRAVEMTISSMFGMGQLGKSHEQLLFMFLSTCLF